MIKEEWKPLWEFPQYSVSNYGKIRNERTGMEMATSQTTHGHVKISLLDERVHERYTRSVALLVANAFVPVPDRLSDAVIQLDGNHANVVSWNLAWRPTWFAWKYTHQLKQQQPVEYTSFKVRNITRGYVYRSVVEAAMTEGLLFDDVLRSHFNDTRIYPHACVYKVVGRV